MNPFSWILLAGAAFFALRSLQGYSLRDGSKKLRSDDLEAARRRVERDPSQSGAHADLAAYLAQDGDLEGAIAHFRAAIGAAPHGPFTQKWKHSLREALDAQQRLARGERVPGFNEWRVCPGCQKRVPVNEKSCPNCGTVLHMSALEWALRSDVQRDIWKQSLPLALLSWVAFLVFTTLPLQWKGALIMVSAIAGGWLILRSFDK